MRCRDVRRHLSAFLDGELEGEVRREIEKHLEGCRECMEEYRALVEAVSLVRELPRLEAPERLWAGIRARLEAEARRGSAITWPLIPLGRRAVAALISIVAVGAILVILSFLLLRGAEEPPIGLYVREHCAFQPFPLSLPIGPSSPAEGAPSDWELQTLIALHYGEE